MRPRFSSQWLGGVRNIRAHWEDAETRHATPLPRTASTAASTLPVIILFAGLRHFIALRGGNLCSKCNDN
jgi:hypothetical protein